MVYFEDKAYEKIKDAQEQRLKNNPEEAVFSLKQAQVYATLAVAEAINKLGKGR